MKKTTSLLLTLTLLLSLLTACAEGERDDTPSEDTSYTVQELAAAVIAGQRDLPELYAVRFDDPEFDTYSMLYLGDAWADVLDGVICYPFGPQASEVTVFEFAGAGAARDAVASLEAYREERAGAFTGYAPEEAELAEEGAALSNGGFAALLICPRPTKAKRSFLDCFGEDAPEPEDLSDYVSALAPQEPSEPDEPQEPAVPDDPQEPAAPDVYDHDAVLTAWETGDTSALTPKNLAVYEACREAVDELIEPGMSDYDKELAINDWMVFHADYDPAELEGERLLTPDPDNDNPYGFLISQKSICLGYANTFQLFMDLIGIQCLTVHGFAHDWSEDHAWNLVNLEGDWYAVDVTWNDPVFTGGEPTMSTRLYYAHSYFNVTSEYLRQTDHQWSEDVPEAEGTRWAYREEGR